MRPFWRLVALSSLTVFTSRAIVLFFSTVTSCNNNNNNKKHKCEEKKGTRQSVVTGLAEGCSAVNRSDQMQHGFCWMLVLTPISDTGLPAAGNRTGGQHNNESAVPALKLLRGARVGPENSLCTSTLLEAVVCVGVLPQYTAA